jgi:hypothetical protein
VLSIFYCSSSESSESTKRLLKTPTLLAASQQEALDDAKLSKLVCCEQLYQFYTLKSSY